MFEEILQKYNLKYEDLTSEERETLNIWVNALQQGQLTVEKIREYVSSMKYSIEQELTKVGHESKQDLFLKARLKNVMLLEAFLTSPERAKAQLDRALSGIGKK